MFLECFTQARRGAQLGISGQERFGSHQQQAAGVCPPGDDAAGIPARFPNVEEASIRRLSLVASQQCPGFSPAA